MNEQVGQPETPKASWRRCTGVRLGYKRDLILGMLQAGYSKRKTAQTLKVSEHSVRVVAVQMGGGNSVSPEQTEALAKHFTAKLKRGLQRVVDENLEAMTLDKTRRASLDSNMNVVDRASKRLLELEGGQERSSTLLQFIQNNYHLQPSHSASEATIDITPPNGQPSDSPDK